MATARRSRSNYYLAAFRIIFALTGAAAVIAQAAILLESGKSLANFFSFFTIESNIIAAIVLLVTGVMTARGMSQTGRVTMLRGAATLYMVMTGIIYFLLLRNVDVQTSAGWINDVLHYVMPLVMAVDWLVAPPKDSLTMRRALVWLVFPVLYLIYSLIRGSLTGWYPYPFIDPTTGGLGSVLVSVLIISIFACVTAYTLVTVIRLRRGPLSQNHASHR